MCKTEIVKIEGFELLDSRSRQENLRLMKSGTVETAITGEEFCRRWKMSTPKLPKN